MKAILLILLAASASPKSPKQAEASPAAPPEGAAEAVETEAVETETASAAQATEPVLDQIGSNVQAFYDGIVDYHADFEQTYTNLALGETQVSAGHVFFQKPGRMRWDYATPLEKYLISDGETLWVYEPEFQQVARVELASSDLPSAVRFLMGEGNLAEEFEISMEECDEGGAYCLDLVPRVSQGHYRSLRFVVNPDDYSVRETTVIDPVGNTNHFEFRNPSTADSLPAEGFEFEPTPEMRVITQ